MKRAVNKQVSVLTIDPTMNGKTQMKRLRGPVWRQQEEMTQALELPLNADGPWASDTVSCTHARRL